MKAYNICRDDITLEELRYYKQVCDDRIVYTKCYSGDHMEDDNNLYREIIQIFTSTAWYIPGTYIRQVYITDDVAEGGGRITDYNKEITSELHVAIHNALKEVMERYQ